MKVKDIKTGKINEVNDAYGARLIEQGKAVAAVQKNVETTDQVAAADKTKAEPAGKDEIQDPEKAVEPKHKTTKARKGDEK